MHYQKSTNIKLLLCSLISINLYANEFTLNDEILSDTRKKSIELTKDIAKEEINEGFKRLENALSKIK